MSNKVIAIVVGVVVVFGGVYFAMRGGSDKVADTNSIAVGEPNGSGTTENTSGKKMSFDAFLKQGGSYVCNVNQSVEGMDSRGTVYVNGANVRGTFNTTVSGMKVDSEFISTGGYMYTWSNMMPGKGFKAKVSATAGGDASTGTSGQYSWNAEQIGDYDCQPWSVDSAKFAMPSGIVFTEIKN